MERYPVRLVLCVDGTWGDPDGTVGNRQGNISNIYRIFSVVQKGIVSDNDGSLWYQKKRYVRGIMDLDSVTQHLRAAVFGRGLEDQIKEVYKLCCLHATRPEDEIFLFGYSRGAFAVKAVATMIHYMRMPKVSSNLAEFDNFYTELLALYPQVRSRTSNLPGNVHHYMSMARPQDALPKIKFVGVFDTVKAFSDNGLYDIVPVSTVGNYREAFALNEYKTAFRPEISYSFLETTGTWTGGEHSLLQAWFIGSHADLGGANKKDGLSLYPLQWILSEATESGLFLGWEPIEYFNFGGDIRHLENPENLLFPFQDPLDPTFLGPFKYRTANGIMVRMWDLRHIHVQRESMMIELHDQKWTGFAEAPREIFHESNLRGYFSHGAVGTFIHPSAYLVYELDIKIYKKSMEWPFIANFKATKANVITNEMEVYWSRPLDDPDSRIDRVRILTCGSTGVGKSTLINKTFGREVTSAQGNAYGTHDVNRECLFEGSQAVIHDSCGFVEGNDVEIRKLEEFIKVRSTHRKLEERLHTIWFCINPSKRERCLLTPADTKFFAMLEKYDCHVPAVIIFTKADRMDDDERAEYYSEYSRLFSTLLGRAVSPIFVSKRDPTSIANLMRETHDGLDNARVRSLFISAQICDVDFKIDQALVATFKWLNDLQDKSSGYTSFLASIRNPAMWFTSDPNQNIGQQLCRIIFKTFGYSETEAVAAASLMRNTFTEGNGPKTMKGQFLSMISVFFGTRASLGAELSLLVIPIALVLMLSIRSIPRLTSSGTFKQMLLIAIIDELLIADHIFWINPKTLTPGAFQQGCDQYEAIRPRVQREVKEMIGGINQNDIFNFNIVKAPIHEIISRNRYKPDRPTPVDSSTEPEEK